MSIINHHYKHIFIHIPKCAGTSMEKCYWVGGSAHATLSDFYAEDKDSTLSYFKWAFIRHPVDRIASAYFYFKGENEVQREIIDKYKKFGLFKQFILDIEKYYRHSIHLLPIDYYIKHDEVTMDFVGKFENLALDWKLLQSKLNIPYSPIKHMNQTQRKPASYRVLYDYTMLEVINTVYKDDLKYYIL